MTAPPELRDTTVLAINPMQPDSSLIEQAAAILRHGGLVAFPTETVYGLGADATDENAVDRIFVAKGRPSTDPIIVHIAALNQLEQVALDIPQLAYQLAERFWAGALTMILKRAPTIPPNVSATLPTVAVRMPSHPVAHALIAAAGTPVAAPSANTFSRPSATTTQHVLDDLSGRINMILDGGSTPIGVESTVLDLTGQVPVVLRPGGVSLEALREIIPDLQLKSKYLGTDTLAVSPGQLIKHYSPRAEMCLYADEHAGNAMIAAAYERLAHGQRVGVLLLNSETTLWQSLNVILEALGDTLEEAAARLFAALRSLDSQGVDVIFAHGYERDGLGAAIWDRLVRAAEGRVIV